MEEGEGPKSAVSTREHLHPAPLMAAQGARDLMWGMEIILIRVSWHQLMRGNL